MRYLWQGLLLFILFLQVPELIAGDPEVDDTKGTPLLPLSQESLTFRGVNLRYQKSFASSQVASLFSEETNEEREQEQDSKAGSSEEAGSKSSFRSTRPVRTHKSVRIMTDNRGIRLLKDSIADVLLNASASMQEQDDEREQEQDDERETDQDLLEIPLEPVDDVPIDFFEQTDSLLEDKFPPRVTLRRSVVGWIGAPVGSVAIPAVCGVIRQASRDMLDAPQGSVAGEFMIGLTSIALLLPYTGKSKQFFEELPTVSKCCRPPVGKIEQAEQELLLPVSGQHQLSKLFLGVVVGINTASMVAHMAYVELSNVEPSAKTKAIYYVTWAGLAYGIFDFMVNSHNLKQELSRIFFRKGADPLTNKKKEFLVTRIRVMKKWLEQAPEEEIKRINDVVMGSQDLEDSQYPWKVSWLIAERVEEAKALKGSDIRWTNFAGDLEVFGLTLPRRATADAAAKLFIFYGTWGRFETLYLGSTLILVSGFGVDPGTAYWLSNLFAGVTAGGKAFWESHLHHELMRKFFRCAGTNASPDGTATLIPAMGSAGVSAGLMALGRFALGRQALAGRYPMGAQFGLLLSAAFLDFSAYLASFGKSALSVARPLARLCLSETEKMRQNLINKCTKLEEAVQRFTPRAIKKLYEWLKPKKD